MLGLDGDAQYPRCKRRLGKPLDAPLDGALSMPAAQGVLAYAMRQASRSGGCQPAAPAELIAALDHLRNSMGMRDQAGPATSNETKTEKAGASMKDTGWLGIAAGQRGGGCEIRTREGLPPTRFSRLSHPVRQ